MFPTRMIERLSLVFAGAGAPALAALADLDREIARAHAPDVDHGVAHAKLGWWRDEIARFDAARPVHPITRRLGALAGDRPEWLRLQARIDAAERELAGLAPATVDELALACRDSHGATWLVAGELLAARRGEDVERYSLELGTALGLVTYVERSRGTRAAPARTAVVQAAVARLERADRLLPAAVAGSLAGASVACALAAAALAPGAAGAGFVQPWIAWRAARRAHSETRP